MHFGCRFVLIFLAAALTSSCAMKVAPAGGPPDRTTAKVSETEPASGTRNFQGRTITVSFDDYVDRSVRNAFVVQPTTRFSTSYAGNEVDVTFEEPLRPNTTYVLTLGTDWRDARGNTPTEAVAVVFATGPTLDSGRITSSVTAASTKNLEAFLYAGADTLSENFDPRNRKPEYRMPIGTAGSFQIGGLKDGRYRLIVVRDDNKSATLDPSEDYVFAPADIDVLNGTADPSLLLIGPSLASQQDTVRIAPRDTTTEARKDTVRDDPPGSLQGTFADSLDLKGPYLIRLRNTAGKIIRAVAVTENGPFVLDSVPPGTYAMDVVIDKNSNGLYDHGMPAPYQSGERWIPILGNFGVRSRWATEDVKVVLRDR